MSQHLATWTSSGQRVAAPAIAAEIIAMQPPSSSAARMATTTTAAVSGGTKRVRPGGTHPTAAERLVSEQSAGRTPKAARRARMSESLSAAGNRQHLVNAPRGVRISNIVCYAVIDCDADLDRRHLVIAIGARFGQAIFPSAVVWLHGTTATLSIFKDANVFKVLQQQHHLA